MYSQIWIWQSSLHQLAGKIRNFSLYSQRFSMARATQANDTWFQNTAAKQIRDDELRRAECINGRVAMLGFTIGLIVEAFSGDGILKQIADLALLSQR
jgi:hypothetical protein